MKKTLSCIVVHTVYVCVLTETITVTFVYLLLLANITNIRVDFIMCYHMVFKRFSVFETFVTNLTQASRFIQMYRPVMKFYSTYCFVPFKTSRARLFVSVFWWTVPKSEKESDKFST